MFQKSFWNFSQFSLKNLSKCSQNLLKIIPKFLMFCNIFNTYISIFPCFFDIFLYLPNYDFFLGNLFVSVSLGVIKSWDSRSVETIFSSQNFDFVTSPRLRFVKTSLQSEKCNWNLRSVTIGFFSRIIIYRRELETHDASVHSQTYAPCQLSHTYRISLWPPPSPVLSIRTLNILI